MDQEWNEEYLINAIVEDKMYIIYKYINSRCKISNEIIMTAVKYKRENILKLILRLEDIDVNNYEGFIEAISLGYINIVMLFVNYSNKFDNGKIEQYYGYGLVIACTYGKYNVVNLLIKLKADIHIDNDRPLRTASYYGYASIIILLLDNGADIHAEEDEAFRFAAGNKHITSVGFLIKRGADIHAKNDEALAYAIYKKNTSIIRILTNYQKIPNKNY